MTDNNFSWINFYMELATQLRLYKESRPELLRKIRKVYSNIGIKLPKLESDNNPKDIDPFSVFGLFNKGISNVNRIIIVKGIAEEFGITAEIPDAFEGIPVLNNMRATFFGFQEDRGKHDIDNLWNLFEVALIFAENNSDFNRQAFISAYDTVLAQLGIRWNITMGLYWIRPYIYVNLDSRNRQYMSNPENMPTDYVAKVKPLLNKVPLAEQYLEIIRLCKSALNSEKYEYHTFPDLSYHAWVATTEANQERKSKETDIKNIKSSAAHIRWTKPIVLALRDLGGSGTPAEVRAKIVENEHLTLEEISITRGKTKVNRASSATFKPFKKGSLKGHLI